MGGKLIKVGGTEKGRGRVEIKETGGGGEDG